MTHNRRSQCSVNIAGKFMEQQQKAKTLIAKHSLVFQGRKTSVSLEEEFWAALQENARGHNLPISELVQQIDREQNNPNLSSAIRVYLLRRVKERLAADVGSQF